MGAGFQTIVDIDATAEEARDLAAATTEWLVGSGIVVPDPAGTGYGPGERCHDALVEPWGGEIGPGGLAVVTERTVFHPGVQHSDEVGCPCCDSPVGMDEMSAIIGAWYDGDSTPQACPVCDGGVGINDWAWDPAWAFGHLGFTFHSWPALSREFVATVAGRLGHRVVLVDGYL